MLDFLEVTKIKKKDNKVDIVPKFKLYPQSKDLMIRGGDFYAIWSEEKGLWSTDEDDALYLIDREISKVVQEVKDEGEFIPVPYYMWDSTAGSIDKWHKYCQQQKRDSYVMLDETLIFANSPVNKEDYASKRLPYPLEKGSISSYDKLMGTLYDEDERTKIEWAIGSIVNGDSKTLQKFLVLYGAAGTGKSTVLNIIQQLFEGYFSVFDAKALGSANSSFALEPFKANPLVAIQHDGDLSRIEDNTRLNSLVSHEMMTVNEKFKSTYTNRFKCFLFMGTNKPVKITDAKSGLLRRLIDVSPTGEKIPLKEYTKLNKDIKFELGAIAWHCKEVYENNPNLYDNYMPLSMMGASNDFYNFVEDASIIFSKEDGVTLKQAWEMYKQYVDDAKLQYPMNQRVFKEELKNYFREFYDTKMEGGERFRNLYRSFKKEIFDADYDKPKKESTKYVIDFKEQPSIFDSMCKDCFAQYGSNKDTPTKRWEEVDTLLKEIDTSKVHYVRIPENHIVIDFDIKDENGNKSFEKNLEEASKWPATYAELSKSGNGIHLHYIYTGDATKLSRIYADDIEIKVFTGKSSLRRKLTKCNDLPIKVISSGLPTKGDKNMVSTNVINNEKHLRTMIEKNLNKEIHGATKPSVDFIYKLLSDAYESGMKYDVSDMKNRIYAFAMGSTNQSDVCIKLVSKMQFKSEDTSIPVGSEFDQIIFYDVEVFPNLFIICWKLQGEENKIVSMINPTPNDVEELMRFRLVGFNNRKYDNHILYARLMGYNNEQLYNLSKRIVEGENNAMFGEAYNISYTDIYDFAATKQSLKKWEIELGIHHQELGYRWDQPVPEDKWVEVADYCKNDVAATEAVFNHLKGDFTARQILADLAGGTVNDTTNSLTTKIIFGKEKHPKLVYTDLATGEQEGWDGEPNTYINKFPGYEYIQFGEDGHQHNMYRGDDLGFGGYVFAQPGMYKNVVLLDIASLHPHSIQAMNCFGEYTKNFTDIMDARIAIKRKKFDDAKLLFNGKLTPYLNDESQAKSLSQALKIAINSVYGLTSAKFDNPFRDIRNKNNIVAVRGALFMRTLQDEVINRGYKVAHIKTDSIKIPDADQSIIDFCMEFANKYGYTFEHEATYEKMCLVNDAVYIAKYSNDEKINGDHADQWTATGTQFQVPYVFKTLFSKEPIKFDDLCETKSVKTALYLDYNESLPPVASEEAELAKITTKFRKNIISEGEYNTKSAELNDIIATGHDYRFVGKVGNFCPVLPGNGGGILVAERNGKYDSVVGTKGYRWIESELLRNGDHNIIDKSYYNKLVDDAVENISQYGDFEMFVD